MEKDLKPFDAQAIFKDFKRVSVSLQFRQLTAVISLLFAGYLMFLSTASVFFVVALGIKKTIFPLYQGAQLAAYLIASLTCGKAMSRWGSKTVKLAGIIAAVLGSAGLLLGAYIFPESPLFLTAAMLPFSFGFIWAQTPYVTEIMELFPDIKGISASVLTSARLMITATVIGTAAVSYDRTIFPTAVIALALVIVICWSSYSYEKEKKNSFIS